jgi:hypothetical protein
VETLHPLHTVGVFLNGPNSISSGRKDAHAASADAPEQSSVRLIDIVGNRITPPNDSPIHVS